MALIAVYTGDSANYHIFQIVDSDDYVGSIYIKKKEVQDLPEGEDITFITPMRDKDLWTNGIKALIENARDGSKAETKLKKTLGSYS